MNKRVKIAVFVVLALIIMIVLIQVLEMADNEAYDKESFIISISSFLGFVLVGVVACFIVGAINTKKVKKMSDAYANKDYSYVIKNSYLCSRLKYHKNIDSLYAVVATSYFEIGNDDEFLTYLGKIQSDNSVWYKYFWMAVYSISVNRVDQFDFWQEKLFNTPNAEENYQRIIKLIEKKNVKDEILTEEERSFIDGLHSDKIKSLFL